jgi:phage terminase small subunit
VGIAEAAASQLRSWAAEFGLTPAAERRIGAVTAEHDGADPFAG